MMNNPNMNIRYPYSGNGYSPPQMYNQNQRGSPRTYPSIGSIYL